MAGTGSDGFTVERSFSHVKQDAERSFYLEWSADRGRAAIFTTFFLDADIRDSLHCVHPVGPEDVMPHSAPARRTRTYAAYAKQLDDRVVLRRFDPRTDSYESLTGVLQRAFAPLGALGFPYPAVDRSAAGTRASTLAGECFVALSKGHLVATITMRMSDPDAPCDPYRSRRVATIRELAVDPVWQARGIGRSLLAFAERWAASRGASHLALDVPQEAVRLVEFCVGEGFRPIDVMRFAGRGYDSAVLCKPVGATLGATPISGAIAIQPVRRQAATS
ncbi:GNAT family N-acetyltransferase [Burkholderia stagnalis]|uniref:GNAT family N-acetyltransferase n=1 Tax=Burkholderia stagnalis TaxID=1503054 RepID=UPI0039BFD849